MLTLAKPLRRQVILLKNPGFSVDNHRFSCGLSQETGGEVGGARSYEYCFIALNIQSALMSWGC